MDSAAFGTLPRMHLTKLASPVLLALILASGCSLTGHSGAEPTSLFNTPLATERGAVDADEAARLISAYRATMGLGPVTVDPTLMAIATDHSDRMARANKMEHVLPGEGSYTDRVRKAGFRASMAAENIAAGQGSLAEVLAAWKKSPGHNANLLLSNVSKIGIALSVAPNSTYKTWWTLELGEWAPAGSPMPGQGPNAGPFVSANGAIISIH